MNANNLLELIKTYNLERTQLFDHCADLLISEIRNRLEETHHRGEWIKLVDVVELGIPIRRLSEDFKEFKVEILTGYYTYVWEDRTINDFIPTFHDFFANEDYEESQLYDFEGKELLRLKPFCEALYRKGLECYVDEENSDLVVGLKIK